MMSQGALLIRWVNVVIHWDDSGVMHSVSAVTYWLICCQRTSR